MKKAPLPPYQIGLNRFRYEPLLDMGDFLHRSAMRRSKARMRMMRAEWDAGRDPSRALYRKTHIKKVTRP